VNELVKPTDEALDLVHEWLSDNGIKSAELEYTPAKDWIRVSLPVSGVERLLDTKYSVYEHLDGDYIVRTPSWSLPLHLHEHIEVIQPTNSFFRPRQQASTVKMVPDIAFDHQKPSPTASGTSAAAVCDINLVTPQCLRKLYGTIDYVPQVPGINRVGLNDFLGESNNRSDVHLFLKEYRPEAAAAAYQFKVEIIANGNNEQTQENATELAAGKDLEGNLDAETILGIDWPTPLTAFTTGGSPPFDPDLTTPTDTNEPYLVWLNYVLAQPDLPQVISTSYADDEQTVPYSYAKAVCNGFAQLGARGISLFFGSGDFGVGIEGNCYSNDGKNTSTFLPMFPTSCPYITSVGATKFIPEIVATDSSNGFVSGGGFSYYFPRPTYQDPIVPAYIASLGSEYKGLYNPNGRGYPDMAAQGYHFVTIWNGTLVPLDGTSASTPTAAAVISLVNDALIAAGKPPLGFLNPWLYAGGYKAFTDVTNGSSVGCGTEGFPAVKGWDAVTGFGTPVSPVFFR
jgi:tripeptidyl-peptidase-1